MPAGVVFRFNEGKGWGFIKADDGGPDVMVHVKEMAPGMDPAELQQDVRVSYEASSGPRGLRAVNVCVLAEEPPPGADAPPGYSDVLTAAQFRDEVSTILADAVRQLEEAARRHGWVW